MRSGKEEKKKRGRRGENATGHSILVTVETARTTSEFAKSDSEVARGKLK